MRVLIVEDEPLMAAAIRDGLRLEAIAADVAGDGDTALALLGVNAYDLAVLDRDIPGPSGDEIAERIVAAGSGMPILMLTAADRLGEPWLIATVAGVGYRIDTGPDDQGGGGEGG
jgi:two-component system, OmpR family, response regulator VanR